MVCLWPQPRRMAHAAGRRAMTTDTHGQDESRYWPADHSDASYLDHDNEAARRGGASRPLTGECHG